MDRNITLQPMTAAHTDMAAEMAWENYRRERQSVPALPDRGLDFFRENLRELLREGTGLWACENEIPVGFLLFGGVYEGEKGEKTVGSPVTGYGICHERRGKIIGLLFQALAASLFGQYVQTFQVTAYAHDTDVLWEYGMLSFAMQHTDLVRRTDQPIRSETAGHYRFQEVRKEELPRHREVIIGLYRSLLDHLRSSPVFYHCRWFLPVEDRFEDFLEEGLRVFAVFDGEQLIGMISAEQGDGTLSESDRADMGMGDVFILPEHRGQGLSAALLGFAGDRLRESGAKRLYVTHGTINPAARSLCRHCERRIQTAETPKRRSL